MIIVFQATVSSAALLDASLRTAGVADTES